MMDRPEALEDVLSFWFVEHAQDAWFTKSDDFDTAIRARFGALLDALAADPEGTRALAKSSARAGLGVLIVLDQFSRNLFRGQAKSFTQDALARDIARFGIAIGQHVDPSLPEKGALFFVLPFEHSEDMTDQDWSCVLMPALMGDEFGEYAEKHRDVIRQFGRFPHRNAALGRASTPEEQVFIDTPGTGF